MFKTYYDEQMHNLQSGKLVKILHRMHHQTADFLNVGQNDKKLYKFKESSQTNTNIRRSAERRKVCKMVASGNMFDIINKYIS